jgi:hypothetical protein
MESALTAFYGRLSPETIYQRFFMLMAQLPPDWAHALATVDHERRMAIVAVDRNNQLIAVARYDYNEESGEAEVAIVIRNEASHKRSVHPHLATRRGLHLLSLDKSPPHSR